MKSGQDFVKIIDSFLTGSFAYGTPTETSDIDLCVLIARPTGISHACFWSEKNEQDKSPRFGKLNILQFSNRERFELWRRVTLDLMGRAPVTRDVAIGAFKSAGFEGYPRGAATDE